MSKTNELILILVASFGVVIGLGLISFGFARNSFSMIFFGLIMFFFGVASFVKLISED